MKTFPLSSMLLPDENSLTSPIGLLIAIGVFLLCVLLLILAGRSLKLFLTRHFSAHVGILARKLVVYLGLFFLLVAFLLALGFDLTGVLATAGIATVAIGFAAQTSLSNLISGLFLIGEKPFQIGDLVKVGNTLGFVESIDLLSIKLRTTDNLFVRIPNEEMIRTQVTNVTRYPIRRMDFDLRFACREDPDKIESVLRKVALANPFALDEPEPLVLFNHIHERAIEFRFGIWFEKSRFLRMRNRLLRDLKREMETEGIEQPYMKIAHDSEPLRQPPVVTDAEESDG